MTDNAFELGEQGRLRDLSYRLYQPLWNNFTISGIDLNFNSWHKIKYLNDLGDDFSNDIGQIPNNRGGIYLFYLKCHIIIGMTEFPLYVGRAQLTTGQNLRKRVREYFTEYARRDDRPKIKKMIRYWGTELFVAYKIIENNQNTIELEKQLINSLLLPLNSEIPDSEIRASINAFPL